MTSMVRLVNIIFGRIFHLFSWRYRVGTLKNPSVTRVPIFISMENEKESCSYQFITYSRVHSCKIQIDVKHKGKFFVHNQRMSTQKRRA